jgi:glutamate formiminotransferase/formiminotetrahydrofolate cyclodeaminase
MEAFGLPKSNEAEKAARAAAIEKATIYAIQIPFKTMDLAFNAFNLTHKMAEIGNPNSVSDAGVGALCLRTAIKGAYMNVRINAQGLENHPEVKPLLQKAEEMNIAIDAMEKEVWNIVLGKIK